MQEKECNHEDGRRELILRDRVSEVWMEWTVAPKEAVWKVRRANEAHEAANTWPMHHMFALFVRLEQFWMVL